MLDIPQNYEQILEYYINETKQFGYVLEFKAGRGNPSSELHANAGITPRMSILVTPEWAAHLVLYNTDEVHNAFRITLGHELTHKEKQLCELQYSPFAMKLIAHVNEVHADFGGTQKMANSSKKALIESIEYKKQFRKNDKSDCFHPSWALRLKYAQIGSFDFNLIQEIARDVKYTNSDTIRRISEFYENIDLK